MPRGDRRRTTTVVDRPVLYPTYEVRIYAACAGNPPLTVQDMKDYLGWVEETDDVKFGSDYLLVDRHGRKIRCEHNVSNRPLYRSVYDALAQKILNLRWRFNSEPIIVGRHGDVLNGQHTLIAGVLAEQDRQLQHAHWSTLWDGPITLEKNVCVGQDDDDDVVNTMDTCKPRTVADVLYRSAFYAGLDRHDRRSAARATDYAIRLLWARTGYADKHGFNAFSPMRTHEEAVDLLVRHPRLLDAVKHVLQEDAGKNRHLSKFIGLGDAAGLLYLMAAVGSDGDAYRNEDPRPSEATLDLSHWEKAEEFWVLLGSGTAALDNVRDALALAVDPEHGGGGRDAKIGVLIKAWAVFLTGTPISKADVLLERVPDEDGIRHLAEFPTLGGIDLGDQTPAEQHDDNSPHTDADVAAARTEVDVANGTDSARNGHDESPEEERARRDRLLREAAARRRRERAARAATTTEVPTSADQDEPAAATPADQDPGAAPRPRRRGRNPAGNRGPR